MTILWAGSFVGGKRKHWAHLYDFGFFALIFVDRPWEVKLLLWMFSAELNVMGIAALLMLFSCARAPQHSFARGSSESFASAGHILGEV